MELTVLEQHALELSAPERAVLADRLLQSLGDVSINRAWLKETEERYDAYDRGEIPARDAFEIFAELRSGAAS